MEAFFTREQSVGRGELTDRRRVVLRGFSMGGAGTWHLGLHFPDKWCVMGPGAGFTTTHGYAGGLPKELPEYQERCLCIYDAIDYAENARMIPIVAYSGGDDPQKLAADNIEKRLKKLQIDGMTHLVAPGLGHSFPPDWFKKANAIWSEHAAKGRAKEPKKISFVTYTTKYPRCEWMLITALEKQYQKTSVEGELTEKGCRLTTKNVQSLIITLPLRSPPPVAEIDGQTVKGELGNGLMFPLTKQDGKWKRVEGDDFFRALLDGTRKRPFLQGPIDDAFAQSFVCVIGSGDTWHPATQKFVDAKVAAFKYDWAKHWRGELQTTGDYAVTPNDINDKNLVLFGDPNSNLTLAQIMPKLPLKWTGDEIEFDGKKYKASEHVPVMIFPNPLNPNRYVVLNTGHTIPSGDYTKTNAMLFPRLGDYAVLRMTPTAKDASAYEVVTAGLFDEFWQIGKK
jgi:dienelactone hydrolase